MNDQERLLLELGERTVSRRGFVAGTTALLAATALGQFPQAAFGRSEAEQLFYYNWGSYVNPKTYPAFTKATGISVKKDFYTSNEALFAKLKGGARGYDLAVPTGYMVRILADAKLLEPINWSKLPTVKKTIDPKFRKLPFDPKDKYSVAKDWGTTGFMYRSDLVKERPSTWRQFFDLAKTKYSGKVTVLDGIPEVIGSALVMLGYSYNSDSKSELEAAKKELLGLKPHLLSITATQYKQLLISGKAVMALGWNGDALAAAAKKPVNYVVGKEGGEFWVDSYVIPVGAKNTDAAHAWIDYVYDPKHNATETEYTYYGSPLRRSLLKGKLDPKILGNPGVFPALRTLSNLEPNNVTAKGTALRSRIWTEFKNA